MLLLTAFKLTVALANLALAMDYSGVDGQDSSMGRLSDIRARQLLVQDCTDPPAPIGCGPETGKCKDNGCDGYNALDGQLGTCEGNFPGCPCKSVCESKNGDCDKNGCEGYNNADGTPGFCAGGPYKGCRCDSVCGSEPGFCHESGCEGVNNMDGSDSFCTAGRFKGCACKSNCEEKDGACDSDKSGCSGINNVCTAGSKWISSPCARALLRLFQQKTLGAVAARNAIGRNQVAATRAVAMGWAASVLRVTTKGVVVRQLESSDSSSLGTSRAASSYVSRGILRSLLALLTNLVHVKALS